MMSARSPLSVFASWVAWRATAQGSVVAPTSTLMLSGTARRTGSQSTMWSAKAPLSSEL